MKNKKNQSNPLFSDKVMDSLLASAKNFNKFKEDIKKSLIDNSQDYFNLTYKNYYSNSLLNHDGDEKDTRISVIKSLSSIFVEFINSKEFNDKNIIQYNDIISKELPSVISLVLLWTQDKKECTFEILKTQSYELTSESYDNLINILNPYKDNICLPISVDEKNRLISDKKDEFLFYLKKFSLIYELTYLPTNNTTSKKIKI